MEILIQNGYLTFKTKPYSYTFGILNKNSVLMYSGYWSLILFYHFKKLGFTTVIFDLKYNHSDTLIKNFIKKAISNQIKDVDKKNINLDDYIENNLIINHYRSTNSSKMSMCQLNITKLKLKTLKKD